MIPLLIYKFKNYEIVTEIEVKEKQYAIGTQPMLYFCFPITELDNSQNLLGRTVKTKETGTLTINSSKKGILLELLKIFGTLTKKHNQDAKSIIELIIK